MKRWSALFVASLLLTGGGRVGPVRAADAIDDLLSPESGPQQRSRDEPGEHAKRRPSVDQSDDLPDKAADDDLRIDDTGRIDDLGKDVDDEPTLNDDLPPD